MHYHVEANALIRFIKGVTRHIRGIQSTSGVTRNSVTFLTATGIFASQHRHKSIKQVKLVSDRSHIGQKGEILIHVGKSYNRTN